MRRESLASQRHRRAGARRRCAVVLAICALALGACAQKIDVRGHMPDDEDLARISSGVHTKDDVAQLLGTPSTVSAFRDSKWYYIGQKSTEFAFFAPEVLERKVVVVSFDAVGVVTDTKVLSLADSQEVDPVARETPTEGRELTFLQQMFGNLGRFNTDKKKQQ